MRIVSIDPIHAAGNLLASIQVEASDGRTVTCALVHDRAESIRLEANGLSIPSKDRKRLEHEAVSRYALLINEALRAFPGTGRSGMPFDAADMLKAFTQLRDDTIQDAKHSSDPAKSITEGFGKLRSTLIDLLLKGGSHV